MSEENNTIPEPELPAFVKKAPELIPVWDWWVKEGKSTLAIVAAAAVCVGAVYGVKGWMKARAQAANNALMNAYSTEEIEEANAKYGSSRIGPAIKLRLAKSYYDAARYADARDVYAAYVKKAAQDDALLPVAMLGLAYSHEGDADYAKAKEQFGLLAQDDANPVSFTAKLGAARCTALAGDKDGALKALDALKEKADALGKTRVERLADMLKRYDPARKPASLLEAADKAALAIKEAAKPAEKPAEAAKPAEKPAEAAKPAATNAPAAK